jgi:predicted anti-sigma-YlaC factor YlaD
MEGITEAQSDHRVWILVRLLIAYIVCLKNVFFMEDAQHEQSESCSGWEQPRWRRHLIFPCSNLFLLTVKTIMILLRLLKGTLLVAGSLYNFGGPSSLGLEVSSYSCRRVKLRSTLDYTFWSLP